MRKQCDGCTVVMALAAVEKVLRFFFFSKYIKNENCIVGG